VTGRQWSRRIRLRSLLRCVPAVAWLVSVPWLPEEASPSMGGQLFWYVWMAVFLVLTAWPVFWRRAHQRCPYCRTALRSVLGDRWIHELRRVKYFPCCGKAVDDEIPSSGKQTPESKR